jgi:regulator of sigma E protease
VNLLVSNGINLFIFIVMLGILVFVHELGHFAVAKRLGVPVFEFGFGFPPRLWRFWRDHGWIEIQGRRIVVPRNFKWPQNLAIGAPVLYKTEMQNGRPVLTGLDVIGAESQSATLTSPVQAFDMGTEYTLNAIPLGGFVRMMGEEDPTVPGGFASAKPSIRIPILLAGVTMNFILALLVFTLTAFTAPPYASVQTTTIAAIVPDSPAALAGLRADDTIVAVNGQDIKNDYPTFRQLIRDNAGREVTLMVVRKNQTLDPIKVVPRVNPPANEGPLGIQLNSWVGLRVTSVAPGSIADNAGVHAGDVLLFFVEPQRSLRDQNELAQFTQAHPGWKIEWHVARGNQLSDTIVVQIPQPLDPKDATLGLNLQTTLLDAPRQAAQDMWTVVASIPTMIGQVFAGTAPAIVGPIGIYQFTGEVAQRGGPIALLQLLALLSLNLAIVNLLPFPGLDGGHLMFVVLEWLRGGKKIDPQKEGLVHLVGLAILLGLVLIISYFDVSRLIAGQPILPTP